MDSKVDIWMPLAIGDYLADTSNLNTTEHGAYLLLLMHYWRKGPLPNDPVQLANIARLPMDAWSMHQAMLMQFFVLEKDGLLHQKRSDLEREKWMQKRAKAQDKASKAAKVRWTDAPSIAPSNASSNAQSNTQAMLDSCPLPSPLPISLSSPKPRPLLRGEEREEKSAPRSGQKDDLSSATNASLKKPLPICDEAWMIARAVVEGTTITSPYAVDQIAQQAEWELKAHPGEFDGIRDGMINAWKAYVACAKGNKLRTTPMGAFKFFGDGVWKTPSMWGLKKGMKAYEVTHAA